VAALQERLTRENVHFDTRAKLTEAGFGSARRDHPSEADLDAIAEFQSAVARVVDAANAEKLKPILQLTRASLQAQFEASARSFRVTKLSNHHGSVDAPANDQSDEIVHKIDELTNLLASVGSVVRQRLAGKMLALKGRGTEATSLEWHALTREITDAVRAERERVTRDRVADELDALIARIDGPTADDLRARILAATTLNDIEHLRPQIHAAIADAERVAEREFVVSQALEVWRELGYVADADFVAHTAAGGAGLLYRDEWPDHALQVRLGSDGASLGTNVVAFGETSALRDADIESESCALVGGFQHALGERGLTVALTRRTDAGKLPVQRLSTRKAKTSANVRKEARRFGR
jgi:hypothetical protein